MAQLLKTIAALAVNASAFSFGNQIPVPECPNGPVQCGSVNPGPCKADQACAQLCLDDENCASVCFDLAPGNCRKDCPEGQSLDPTKWCECIDDADRLAMFCAPEDDSPAEPECPAAGARQMPFEAPIPGFMPGKDKPKLLMAQDIDYPPYATTIPPPDGLYELGGFALDFARGIQEMAPDEIEFEFQETRWANCFTNGLIGEGLQAGWFHGCMSYTSTQGQRQRQMDFSHAILDTNKVAGIMTRLDADGKPVLSPLSNLEGVKIADVVGWAPTADTLEFLTNSCTGERYSDYMLILPMQGNDAALKELLDGNVDAVYIYADQATLYKKACKDGTATPVSEGGWDCNMWERFEKDFAYVGTGLAEFQRNGTTLAMVKKGSGVTEILNPLIARFIGTKEYKELCDKWGFTDVCYKNEFFAESSIDFEKQPYLLKTIDMIDSQSCKTGYCHCDA